MVSNCSREMVMAEISFDFQKYISERKGADETLALSGTAYTYPADRKVLRALGRVTPVTLAVEATVRLWKRSGGGLLAGATRVTEKHFPELYRSACLCAERLHLSLPALYVAAELGGPLAYTFGTGGECSTLLRADLPEKLGPAELRFIIGHECGHVQNGHVLFMTALHYLTSSQSQFVRWIVRPAVLALRSWARRGEISCDRAGLICAGELAPAAAALTRLALGRLEIGAGLDLPADLALLEEGRAPSAALAALGEEQPDLLARLTALRLFSQTHYFLRASGRTPREDEGKSLAWCDARVKALLSGRAEPDLAQGD
jgi:Zn-dependent protease with chaperone function